MASTALLVAVCRAMFNLRQGWINKCQNEILTPQDYIDVEQMMCRMPLGTPAMFGARMKFELDVIMSEAFGKRGTTIPQIVLLGAGYDVLFSIFSKMYSDGICRKEEMPKMFEVDLPSIQEDKRRRVAGVYDDRDVNYIPHDFKAGDLLSKMEAAGFNPKLKTCFVMMGVSYYLTLEEFDKTMADISAMASPSSILVMDYGMPVSSPDADQAKAKITEQTGEGFKFFTYDISPHLWKHKFLVEEEVSALNMIIAADEPVYEPDHRLLRFVRATKKAMGMV